MNNMKEIFVFLMIYLFSASCSLFSTLNYPILLRKNNIRFNKTGINKILTKIDVNKENNNNISNILTNVLISTKLYTEPNVPYIVRERRKKNLIKIINKLNIEDFGFNQSVGLCEGPNCVRCYKIYNDSDITLSLFRLPKGSKIPMHSHPGMEIFCCFLFGEARYNSCDLGDIINNLSNRYKINNFKEVNCSNNDIQIIGTNINNLHEIEVLSDNGLAFFDIIITNSANKIRFFVRDVKMDSNILYETDMDAPEFKNYSKKNVEYNGKQVDLAKIQKHFIYNNNM